MGNDKISESLTSAKLIPNHKFYTPSILAEDLVKRINFDGAKVALDPCSGKGAFYRAFPKWIAREECEIEYNKGNFYDWNINVCWIVSNPPFDNLTKWIEHTCKYADLGFAYLLPTYAITHNRLKMIESWGFYCDEMTLIENPKEWNLGFPMAFYIFKKDGARVLRCNSDKEPVQSTLQLTWG
jgi:hypothetical protein